MALCQEDIDGLSLEEAVDWLEDRSICYDLLETHDEILDLIRATLKDENPSGIQFLQSEEIITDCFTEYDSMRRELSNFYIKDLKSFVKDHLDDELRTFINNIYTDIDSRLDRNHDDLMHSECAIVVAGETSSGKSSFLNLLIGSDVLPHSLLANTSAICQIHNSDQKHFQVVKENGHCCIFTIDGEGPKAEKELVKKLGPYIGRSSAGGKGKLEPYIGRYDVDGESKIKHVNIYWPVPLLKKHVTLVDTPGVGESPKMTEKLVKYLPNAVAFIYVINSANAGGIQEDTILHIISEQLKLDADQELSSFDPANMIFVCNKWDIVEKRGMADETWQDTVQKLQRTIPGLKEDHIFKLSVSEATKYRRSGIGNTELYQRLLEGLEHFIPGSLIASIKRHYRWFDSLLSKLMTSVTSRISNASKSAKERKEFVDLVRLRLKKLETSSEKVRIKLTEAAKKECQFIVQELHRHLSSDDIVSKLQTWTEAEAPDIIEDDIEVTKYEAQQMINKRLLDVFKTWEKDFCIVEKAAQNIRSIFNKECLLLTQECRDVDNVLRGESDEISQILGGQPKSKSKEATEDISLNAGGIVVIAATSPIWIPLGIAYLAVAFPVALGYEITKSVKHALVKKEYRKNKAKYMRKWAHDSSPKIDTIHMLIKSMWLQHMLRSIDFLCSECIPKQIEADRTQLRNIENDKRTAAEIIHHFEAKKHKLKGLHQTLCLFDLKYFTDDVIGVSRILRYSEIGSGSFSDVYRATWRQTNGDKKDVALKSLKGHDMYMQLSEVDCSRRLRHENIVEFYGVVFADRERYMYHGDNQKQDIGLPLYDDRLMLVLDLCEQSLESLVFETTELQCGSFPCNLRTRKTHQYFFEMAISICEGLEYMHEMKCLHRDLKLSNVLVKNGIGKLCDLGFARAKVEHITGTVVGTLTHMAPELLNATIYSFSSDVYSLGILLWELWYGKSSYSDAKFSQLGVGQFINAVTEGARPDCELEYAMVPDLKILVEKCWGNDANTRPNVKEVKTKLKNIDEENRRDIQR